MLSPKENLLETLKRGGKPDRLVKQYEALCVLRNDPLSRYTRGDRRQGVTFRDVWGTVITWPENQPAAIPYVTAETKAIPDITRWSESLRIPNLETNCRDWGEVLETVTATDRDSLLIVGHMGTGVFEQCHALMGFEDTLINLLLEPECMMELVEAIGDYRCKYAELLIEHLRPDAILSNDDWGNKSSLFMQPDIWRKFFKPQYKRLYGMMKDSGVMVIHHADSFLEPLMEDMVELGIDIWQGVLPTNDIQKLQRQLGGRMTLMGGIDSVIDRPDATEEVVRTEVRRACMQYATGGHYIPSITYGAGKTIFPGIYELISEEIDRCSAELVF